MMEPEADEVVVVDNDKPAVVAAANDIGICTGEEDSWVPTEERVDGADADADADADAVAFFISLLMFPLGELAGLFLFFVDITLFFSFF